MYRTAVTICTAQRSIYMYRTAVTIWTAQRSLYLPHSGQYMYRTAVTTCTAQWSLYVPHSGHYLYRQFNIQQFYVLPTQCIYVFCVDLRTNSHYFPIQHNWLVCITETVCVYCAVRTEYLYAVNVNFSIGIFIFVPLLPEAGKAWNSSNKITLIPIAHTLLTSSFPSFSVSLFL